MSYWSHCAPFPFALPADPLSPELLLGAVRCLGAWAGLDDSGAGGATGISVGELEVGN